jgi:KaiC/GvpD/RAD55 family RecA-like ATPase
MSDSNSESFNNDTHHQTYKAVDGIRKTTKRKNIGHLPSEILKFVKNESYSLLIKGKPGTGKTTFALTLLDNLNDDSNYFYISTRLSLKQLAFYFPWIEKFFSKDENKSGYRFEDARLDEPESLFERITNQLMDVKSPVIIIDTWDTIASFMDRESRLNNERVLQIWRERAGAKLIFLSETFDLGILDSIVDGVITLENNFHQANNWRLLRIDKLRGLPIHCNTYTYSLFNGVFHSSDIISQLNLFDSYSGVKPYYKRSIHIAKKKSVGVDQKGFSYFELENLFTQNRMTYITIEPTLSYEVLLSVLLKPLLNWLQQSDENKLMINNFDGLIRESYKRILNHHLSEDLFKYKVIEQEIDFTDPHGIKLSKQNDDFTHIVDKTVPIRKPTQTREIHFDSADYSNLKPSLNNANQVQILNILNTDNIDSLLSEDSFLELLNESFALNILIQRGSFLPSQIRYLRNVTCCEFKTIGKNLLLEINNHEINRYQMILDKDRSFVNLHPIL